MDAEELLQAGIEYARVGDFTKASRLLTESLKLNPNSEQAWLWLGNSLTTLEKREYCYKRVLAINPNSAEAKQQLERLTASISPFTSAPAKEPPQIKPAHHQVESIPGSSSLIKNPDSKRNNNTRFFASFTGFIIGFLIFGGLLVYAVMNGSFARRTMPFAAVMWTPTQTQTSTHKPTVKIIPTSTQTPTYIPSPTATLTYSQRMALADPFYTEGFKQFYAGKWAESILAWNKAIELVPEDAVPYRMRGDAYMKLLDQQRYLEEYLSDLGQAISDYDAAIIISPTNGDYYLARYKAYDTLASVQETRVDFQAVEKVALENLQMAYFYGNTDELSKRNILFTLIDLGECDKAIDEIKNQFSEQTQPSATLNTAMAMAQFCKGNPSTALKGIDEAIKITDQMDRSFYRALILYTMGKYPEAEKEISRTIDINPYYGGYRYYLRGLIYSALGELDKAQQDLDFGSGNTWIQGGLLAYAQGKIALAKNDKESAISYFQEAEATYFYQDMILDMIRVDLAKLNAKPIEVEPYPLNVTSIPSPTASLTPRPTSTPQFTPTPNKFNFTFTPDPNLNYASVADLENGTGPFTLNRSMELLFRFQPAQPLDMSYAQSLSILIQPSEEGQDNTIQIFLYDFEIASSR